MYLWLQYIKVRKLFKGENYLRKYGSLSQFSLLTGFFEGTRENILHIFWNLKRCRKLSFSLHQRTTVCWKVGRNLNGCGFSHYHQAKDGKKLCSMGHNKHLPNGLACLLLHENSCGASSLMYTVRPVLMLHERPVLELQKCTKIARFLREFIITYIL